MQSTAVDQEFGSTEDQVLIERMLELSPEARLLGLIRAAEFFAAARRV
ncbi:MAG TPA: hypothetical protein VGA69_08505 [Nitriliruptorales bacterium]